MNIDQIEAKLKQLASSFSKDEFIFDLLLAYEIPKATVTLLKKGQHNLSKQSGRIILKRKLFFQEVEDADLHETIDSLQKDNSTMRHTPRFLIVTDYRTLLAVDMKTNEHLDIPLANISKHYDFFLPWAGIEKHRNSSENPADRKAAEKMAKLYDEIMTDNTIADPARLHDLNVFLTRLLFCLFAEDTKIFPDKLFTDSVASHTQENGSDLSKYLERLFDALNTEDRSEYPFYLQRFPYVNGGLFSKKHWIPEFTARSRKIIVECGQLDWSKINPDIFGSMMQAVTHPGIRGSLGMHYTSVPNIMKVINPLFLDELKEELENSRGNKRKLLELLNRISKIKFFDPACGSGNFLIITYKELRRLEVEIIKELGIFAFPGVSMSQFYGIEIDDFAHEIARLSLYLAEHQMNIEFEQEFGKPNPTLPLKIGGNIVCANATRINWKDVCTPCSGDEIYVLGNPPYLGSRNQDMEQKNDMKEVFKVGYKSLDYISCWFFLGAKFISNINAKMAFVSTNSITQGEQVSLLWPKILNDYNVEISFAYQSFKWTNSAKRNAGVTVVIIGMRTISKEVKKIFNDNMYTIVDNINPYLTAGDGVIVFSRSKPFIDMPKMNFGNMPADDGLLLFDQKEKDTFIKQESGSQELFRRLISADQFLNGKDRWCLWLKNYEINKLLYMPLVAERINKLRKIRQDSARPQLARIPHLFAQITQPDNMSFILIPRHSSENRDYIPIGFFDSSNISHDSCLIIAGAEVYLFGLLTSRMHMVWVRAIGGRLKTDYRYSAALCYNTFPFIRLTSKQKEEINGYVYSILEERERHSEKTLAEMYDPKKMPASLKEAHHRLDLAIERCYRLRPFSSDEERLEFLFKLYKQMIEEENINNR